MNLKFMLAGLLSFANLAGRTKPAAAPAAITPAKPTQAAPVASTVINPVPASQVSIPAVRPAAEVAPADDDEAELLGTGAVSRARERERARCSAIFASAGAARNPVLARTLAFSTSMTRSQAIATLDAMPEQPYSTIAYRNPNREVRPAHAQAAGWDRAFKQVPTR